MRGVPDNRMGRAYGVAVYIADYRAGYEGGIERLAIRGVGSSYKIAEYAVVYKKCIDVGAVQLGAYNRYPSLYHQCNPIE